MDVYAEDEEFADFLVDGFSAQGDGAGCCEEGGKRGGEGYRCAKEVFEERCL